MQFGGNIAISLDGEPYAIPLKYIWKSMIPEGLPNAALMIGYTNNSWTLGDISDIVSRIEVNRKW